MVRRTLAIAAHIFVTIQFLLQLRFDNDVSCRSLCRVFPFNLPLQGHSGSDADWLFHSGEVWVKPSLCPAFFLWPWHHHDALQPRVVPFFQTDRFCNNQPLCELFERWQRRHQSNPDHFHWQSKLSQPMSSLGDQSNLHTDWQSIGQRGSDDWLCPFVSSDQTINGAVDYEMGQRLGLINWKDMMMLD